jgi:hypothetical protein
MRFRLVALIALLALPTAVSAQDCGSKGSGEVLVSTDWQAVQGAYGVTLTMRYKNAAAAPIKMVDGAVWFTDALGGSIGGWPVDRDAHIAPGAEHTNDVLTREKRFLDVAHEDITALLCVKAVLFEDGTKQEF